jgi:hypothetical protein
MKSQLNNRGRILPIGILILLLLLSFLFYTLAYGYHLATYTESAHGNSPYGVGVNREGLNTPVNFGYSKGNCAHCHEQHASIGGVSHAPYNYLLFAEPNVTSQDYNFCFQCHKGTTGSVQYPNGIPNANNDYSTQFGGGASKTTNNIKDTFAFGQPLSTWNDGSSHNLLNLRDWWMSKSGGNWMTANTNACIACHDAHYSQKNHDPYPTPPQYKTAIRKPDDPSSSQNRPRNLWGDESNSDAGNEIMSEYTIQYQAPYRVGKTTYEPAGDSTQDGSNLPNFVDFCNTCHDNAIPHGKTDANVDSRNLYDSSWGTHGNVHGKNAGAPSATNGGHLIAPYSQPDAYNYVLSCTDCHEPHGSPNPFLLRTCVNGKDNIQVKICSTEECLLSGKNNWNYLNLYDFCSACHSIAVGAGTIHNGIVDESNKLTTDCMSNGGCHTHSNTAIF